MRNLFNPALAPALATLILLGACNSGGTGNQTQTPTNSQTAAAANSIVGTVTTRDKITLSPHAKLEVKLVDIAHPQMPIAEQTVAPVNQVPASFSLSFDPSKIDQAHTYVVEALLSDGQRRFIPALQSPVLTRGAGARVEIMLNTEPTAADKLKEEFNLMQARIGGMKKIEDTLLTDDISVGWDAFISEGKVQFMREITDKGDKGRTTIKYAFKDDKPMALLVQDTPPGSKNPTTTLRLGWNDAGELLLNEKTGGGEEASAAATKEFYEKSQKALKTAQDKAASMKKK